MVVHRFFDITFPFFSEEGFCFKSADVDAEEVPDVDESPLLV